MKICWMYVKLLVVNCWFRKAIMNYKLNKYKNIFTVSIVILCTAIFTINTYSQDITTAHTNKYNSEIIINDTKLFVEIAASEYTRSIGLMYRQSMPDSCGMLFVFEEEQVLSFWMKNTYIPLSIAYLDGSGYIVSIKDMEPHDEKSISSDYPAVYALEMNKGWFLKKDIRVGDKLEF